MLPPSAPPPPPPPTSAIRKVCSLWVHSPAFSRDDVLFNASILPRGTTLRQGRLLKILPHRHDDSLSVSSRNVSVDLNLSRHSALPARTSLSGHEPDLASDNHLAAPSTPHAFVFLPRDLTDEQKAKYPNLQVSVSEAIASVHAFQNRMSVLLVEADHEEHAASHVELNFKDPLDRDDLWKMIVSELHRKQCLYEGQKLLYLGAIEFSVRKIYVRGQKSASAVFTDQSKPIFRSLAARFVLGVQISSEMWDFDHDSSCEIKWVRTKAFLAELFDRWDSVNAKHNVSIFFFTRLAYNPSASSPNSAGKSQDFYRVVGSELPSSACTQLLTTLDREFRHFLRHVEFHSASATSGLPTIEGHPVLACKGNFLEAVNLAASASLHDDIDLDFVRTGTLVLMLTPGPTVFEVDESLLRMTNSRLISRQIGVELVSTALPPLHVAPLFVLSQPSKPHPSPTYVIPSWIEISFYEGPKKKKNLAAMKHMSATHEYAPHDFDQQQQPQIPQTSAIRADAVDNAILGSFASDLRGPNCLHDISARSSGHDNQEEALAKMDHHDRSTFTEQPQETFRPSTYASSAPRFSAVTTSENGSTSSRLAPTAAKSSSRASNSSRAHSRPSTNGSDSEHFKTISVPSGGQRQLAEIKIGPFRGGLLYGKASATTGSTSESAKSSRNEPTAPTAQEEDAGTFASRFRASLLRKTSSNSLDTRNTAQESKAVDIPSLKSASEDLAAQAEPHQGSAEGQSQDERAQNFFGAPSSYHRRMKLHSAPSVNPAKRAVRQTSDELPWFVVRSPFKPRRSSQKTFGEWNHVFTRQTQAYTLKWKALCTPASLPLTTEDFPSSAQLRAGYSESPYRLAITDDAGNSGIAEGKRAHLARELLQSRISEGFQIAVGRRAHEITGSADFDLYADDLMSQEGAAVLVVKGDDVQLLCASGGEVAVTRFQPRRSIPQPIIYQANICTALEERYHPIRLVYASSSEKNWNTIDNHMASFELDSEDRLEAESNVIRRRRARFVLIPIEPASLSTSASGSGNEDSDEEIRIEGIRKLTMLWQKNRWLAPSEQRHKASWAGHKDTNPLAIEYHTRDPSAVVAAGMESLSLTEGESLVAWTQLFNKSDMFRTSHVDLQKLAAEIQGDKGIRVRPRRWHFRMYEYCFVGTDLTSFLLATFQDIATREEAVDFGNALMEKNLFHHVHGKHAFRDGNYFYIISSEYRQTTKADAKGSSWFGPRKEKSSVPSTPLSERVKEAPDMMGSQRHVLGGKRSRVCLSALLQYNLDPRKTSTRLEVITIHYDRLHNPENAFHFEVEWSNATPRLVEDALVYWATAIAKYGLKLVQLPVAEAALISQINPLRSPYVVELAVRPPSPPVHSSTESPRLTPQQPHSATIYQKAILRKLNFVLDFEAASSFPPDVDITYTWGTPGYRHAQYIHRSGILLAQMVDDSTFLLLANRFYNNRAARAREHMNRDKTPEKAERERRGVNATMPRPASALFTHASPVSSPVLRAAGDLRTSPSQRTAPLRKARTAEELKDKFEAFCHDTRSLRALYDEVTQSALTPQEKPTPALSAASTQATPLLQASVPSLDIAEEGEDEDEGLVLPPRV